MSEEQKKRIISRREMLKMTGATGVGLLASACAAQPMTVERVVTVEVEKEVEKVVTVEVEKEVDQEVETVVEAPAAAADIEIDGALWVLQSKDFHPEYNDYLRQQVSEYAASKGWPLDISFIAGFTSGSGEVEKIAASVQSGNPPDMILHTLSAIQLRNLYALDPVSDVVEELEASWGKAAPAMYVDFFFEDQWWAIPYHQRSDGGWYRTDAFEAVGIDLQQTTQYTTLREQTLEASDPDNELFGWGMTINRSGDGNYLINRIKTGWGASWQDETGQFITTNSPEMIDAMTFIKETYTDPQWEPMLPPGVLSWNDTANNEAYLGGKIGFTQNAGTVYAKAVSDGNPVAPVTAFLKPPGGPVLEDFHRLGGKTWMILRGAKNARAAKDVVLTFMLEEQRYNEMLISSPSYAIPCFEGMWDEARLPFIAEDAVLQQQKSSALDPTGINAMIYPGPPSPAIVALDESGAWNDMVNAIVTGTPVEEAVADAHARMVSIFQEFGLPGEPA